MTVIAWDGKTLAADRRAVQGGFCFASTKIFRVNDFLVGFSGNASRGGEYLAWLREGGDPKKFPENKDENDCFVWLLVIRADGTIEKYENSGYPIIVDEKHFALGSGQDFATAAMYLGFDAVKAVEVASRFDEGCGNGIDTLTFDSP